MTEADIVGNTTVIREVVRQVKERGEGADTADLEAVAGEAALRLLEGLLIDINRIAQAMEIVGTKIARSGFQ